MSFTPPYVPTTSFANDEANSVAGRSIVRTAAVDVEFANISASITQLKANIQKMQRDDDKLLDFLVEPYALSEATLALIATGGKPRGVWAMNTNYIVGDVVQNLNFAFICYTAHASGSVFLSSGFWISISGDGTAGISAASASNSAIAANISALASQAAVSVVNSGAAAATAAGISSNNSANAANTSALSAQASSVSAANSAALAVAAPTVGVFRSELANQTNASLGAGLLGFYRSITGFFGRTISDKLADSLSVKDFRQTADVDDSLAFQRAANALPATGGRVLVPDGNYVLTTQPNWGNKSIQWDIGPGVKFTGSATVGNGSFPRAVTNISMLPVGRFIQSQSNTLSTPANATAVDVIDVIQPVGMNGGSVGSYVGVKGNNSGSDTNLWATNFLVESGPASTGGVYGCEIDVNCYSSSAIHFGLDITGVGNQNPDFGLIIQRADTTVWDVGIEIRKTGLGINMPGSNMTRGISINNPVVEAGNILGAKQLTNGDSSILLQRNTDTAPSGKFLKFINNANSAELFTVDVLGNIMANGAITLRSAAASTFTAALSIGNTTSVTAVAGGVNVPATANGFINAFIGATPIRIPFYGA
jgi:hypothetical protein